MKLLHHGFLWLAAAGTVLVLGACVDKDSAAGPITGNAGPSAPPAAPVMLQALDCQVEVRTMLVKCAPATPAQGPSYLIVGGQNQYVTLTSSNPSYVPATGAFTMDVTVRNLIPQPLGTADSTAALAPDANGVRVFFSTPPVATAGTGDITVAADGQDVFTAAAQDYYQYGTVLEQFEVSAAKQWTFNVPSTVETFHFGVFVAAAVPWPDGYVVITGTFTVRSAADRQLTARAYNAVGELDPAVTSFTWMALDSTRAKVSPTGLAHGQRAGTTAIVATAVGGPERHGKVNLTVTPIRRTWTGAAGVTAWENGTNWMPDSIVPVAGDTAEVPDTTAAIFPVLSQAQSVGGLEVLDLTPGGVIPVVDLQSFNLSVGGDAITTNQASVTSTVGRLFLEGDEVSTSNVQGNLPITTVTGRYQLSGNVSSRATLRIVGGRLRNTSFRIRTLSN